MSELIQKHDNRATIRWKLLTGASALALTMASASAANAGDADHPLLWIELGGQVEQTQGMSAPFTAPFMSITPTPDVYNGMSFTGSQRLNRYSFGEEASLTFQPENSDWNFSAGIRYGRSHSKRHRHHQHAVDPVHYQFPFTVSIPYPLPSSPYYVYHYTGTRSGTVNPESNVLADTRTQSKEQHLILDFTAGKDVGLGLFGRNGLSTLDAGVRFASFTSNSSAYITARPNVNIIGELQQTRFGYATIPYYHITFHQYLMSAQAKRSFMGIGPTLSWNASAPIAGNEEHGELSLDWGVNGAILFGKQKAKTEHWTKQYYHLNSADVYPLIYSHAPPPSIRSRTVTVPNLGGFVALSAQFQNAKISIGYRYDTFLNAMDTGIDAAKKSDVTFQGPFASISIGIGD